MNKILFTCHIIDVAGIIIVGIFVISAILLGAHWLNSANNEIKRKR